MDYFPEIEVKIAEFRATSPVLSGEHYQRMIKYGNHLGRMVGEREFRPGDEVGQINPRSIRGFITGEPHIKAIQPIRNLRMTVFNHVQPTGNLDEDAKFKMQSEVSYELAETLKETAPIGDYVRLVHVGPRQYVPHWLEVDDVFEPDSPEDAARIIAEESEGTLSWVNSDFYHLPLDQVVGENGKYEAMIGNRTLHYHDVEAPADVLIKPVPGLKISSPEELVAFNEMLANFNQVVDSRMEAVNIKIMRTVLGKSALFDARAFDVAGAAALDRVILEAA